MQKNCCSHLLVSMYKKNNEVNYNILKKDFIINKYVISSQVFNNKLVNYLI
jgi:hypothetical protein